MKAFFWMHDAIFNDDTPSANIVYEKESNLIENITRNIY